MTLEGTFIEDRTCHLPDVNGFHASIPVRHLHVVAHAANQADNGRATYGTRVFGRDALNGALDLAFPKCDQCHERPATEDMCEDHRFCEACCSAAQGSIYDDRIEF